MTGLSEEALAAALAGLPGWSVDGDSLVRSFRRADFTDAVGFIDRIAVAAEEANHHPDLCLHRYRTVEVRLTTHSEGGVTERDLSLARAIDALAGADQG